MSFTRSIGSCGPDRVATLRSDRHSVGRMVCNSTVFAYACRLGAVSDSYVGTCVFAGKLKELLDERLRDLSLEQAKHTGEAMQ